MAKIQLDSTELEMLSSKMQNITTKIREVSSGGYVTENLFSKSKGQSVDTMTQCLGTLVDSANEMEAIANKTALFFEEVIEEFEMIDSTNAVKINANESLDDSKK
ncbi:hypothetical protein [uncultured Enterococcus sp.]|uniref:hypothetical protein n=1 Tax=uncultured Enterococcus sp. TaxID=167972 RepID=UPI002AA6FDDD|nr:hypothetical protein [uncultured Enterococcus sp.]